MEEQSNNQTQPISDQTMTSDPAPANDPNPAVDTLFAIEGLIKNQLSQIETLITESKRLKEMFDDYMVNDPEVSKTTEAAKEAVKAKAAAKKQALAKPEAESITNKLKDAKEQLKDLQESLSNHLREYGRLSGSDQFEIEPGDIRQIVYKARLIKAPGSQPNY